MPPFKGLSHSMRSGDWLCPRCNSFQFGQNMACRMCSHAKPTLKTLGQRAMEYYPLADQRRKFEGERHCPDCHAIIHQSHSQCLACRDRPTRPEYQDPLFTGKPAPPARGVLKGPGGVAIEVPAEAPEGHGGLASFSTGGGPADLGPPVITPSAAIPASRGTAYGALCDQYSGMSPEEVLADLERQQEEAKGPSPEQLAAEAERLKAKREQDEVEAAEARAKAAEDAKLATARFETDRAKTQSEAELRIQAMLDRDEREAKRDAERRAAAGEPPSLVPAAPPTVTKTPQVAAAHGDATGEVKTAWQFSEREEAQQPKKESKEERKRKKEEAEQEQRKRMRERRLARNAAAVVIDDESTPATVFL